MGEDAYSNTASFYLSGNPKWTSV